MAVGLASAIAAELLDAFLNADAYTGPAAVFVKLHIGDPGAAGTANPATETTRQAVTFGVASGGAIANDADVTWTAVAGSEDFTHYSLWSDVSAGSFLFSGTVTADAVTAGNDFTIASGDLDITITGLAA